VRRKTRGGRRRSARTGWRRGRVVTDRLGVLDVLRRTEQYLSRAGIETARLDAEVLLAYLLGASRIQLYTGYDRPLTGEEIEAYRVLVRRRAERVPVAYLTGVKEFHSLPFRVTFDVLVPRPETELLVERAIALSRGSEQPHLLDLGTGSGCIAVAFAVSCPDARATAVDISAEALEVARENAGTHGVLSRTEWLCGDLYGPLAGRGPFDLVVSNPPYVAPGEETDPECRQEPTRAVFTEGDPLEMYERILSDAPRHLKPGGHLLVELPGDRSKEIGDLLPSGMTLVEIVPDYQDLPRVLVARRAAEDAGGAGTP
jgi:release factor glutamine methyltransferase